jgi:chaperonin cofactor prefoldin
MATNATPSLQQRLDAATRKYQDLQEELSKNVEARERLGAQQAETQSVKKGRWNINDFDLNGPI